MDHFDDPDDPDEPMPPWPHAHEDDLGNGDGTNDHSVPEDWSFAPEDDYSDRRREEKEVLTWILPQLSHIENDCEILLDSSRVDHHDQAARNIIRCLRMGTRQILDLGLEAPDLAGVAIRERSQEKQFLHAAGMLLDEYFRVHGLPWPPPMPEPPPAVVRDLLLMYDEAVGRSRTADRDSPAESLDKILGRVARRSQDLLDGWSVSGISAARAMAQPVDGTNRSIIGVFLSGVAVIISLLQGPGALHNFSSDLHDLGGDVRDVVTTVVAGVSGVLDRIAGGTLTIGTPTSPPEGTSRLEAINEHSGATANARPMDPSEVHMREIIETLDASAGSVPVDQLAAAGQELETAISRLSVLSGSKDEERISSLAERARQNLQDAHHSAAELRDEIRSFIEQHR
jgi:hypothetical protein